jgi:hypothetical protein
LQGKRSALLDLSSPHGRQQLERAAWTRTTGFGTDAPAFTA